MSCIVGNLAVDISLGRASSLAPATLLEEADRRALPPVTRVRFLFIYFFKFKFIQSVVVTSNLHIFPASIPFCALQEPSVFGVFGVYAGKGSQESHL